MNGPKIYRQRLKIDLLIHDLKGPLGVIETGVTALLTKKERYGTPTEKQDRVLQRVLRNTKIAKTLVNDTLELQKSQSGVMSLKNVKLSNLITDSLLEIFDLSSLKISRKIKRGQNLDQLKEILGKEGFLFFIEAELWNRKFFLDEIKVKQILRNLLTNAMKYKKSRVELEVDKKNGCLLFSVKDDGKGIPSIYQEKIFESYFQLDNADETSLRGHGLGLAGVMILVEDMKGKLLLESSADKGAKFIVHLPLSENKN